MPIFPDCKYKLYKKALKLPDIIFEYIVDKTDRKYNIFNNKENDEKRTQLDFKCKIGKHITKKLQAFIETKGFQGKKINDLVILHSADLCKRQQLHYDYEVGKLRLLDPDKYPFGVIVGVQDNSRLIVYNEIHQIKETIHFNKGDVILFRGDLLHAGAEYYKKNTRMHAYIDSPEYKREKNSTYFKITNYL